MGETLLFAVVVVTMFVIVACGKERKRNLRAPKCKEYGSSLPPLSAHERDYIKETRTPAYVIDKHTNKLVPLHTYVVNSHETRMLFTADVLDKPLKKEGKENE